MDDLLQFIPEEKQEEFKTAFSGAGYIKGDETTLIDTVKKNQRVFDLITKDPMENRIKNFKEKDLPVLIGAAVKEAEEKVRAELNPKETEERKLIRELQEKDAAREKILADKERKELLRETYKDIDSGLAESLYKLDDDEVKRILDIRKADIDKIAELEKTIKYGGEPPKGGGGGNVISEAEFMKKDPKARAEYMASGGQVE